MKSFIPKNFIKDYLEKNSRQIVTIVGAFVLVGVLFSTSVFDFQANVLAGKKSATFDGTTTPIKKSPNWVDLAAADWKLPYEQIPQDKFIDFPTYDPTRLAIPTSSLNYKNQSDKLIRDEQVTFSTPYMGNYKLDGKEYAGSHLAVDIKVPMNTPVYAIANAVVVKAANQSSGFGYHLVLRHDDVPSFNDSNSKTTYYSNYAHLSSYLVAEGDSVSKGQLIGYTGNSGTATTPHLHFQIDNDQAPWHPYWPYTSKEASDAGLTFWGAVDAGLGKDKALATTINPMLYVQKYLNGATGATTSTPVTPVVTQPTTPVEPVVITTPVNTTTPDELPPVNNTQPTTPSEPVNVVSTPTVDVNSEANLSSFDLKYNDAFSLNTDQTFKVIALDSNGEVIKNFAPKGEVSIRLENGSGNLNKSYLTASDFRDGFAEFKLTPTAEFGLRVSVSYNGVGKTSNVIQATSFNDLSIKDENYEAINFLKNNEIVRGYPDGSFKADNPVSRVEALKFIYEGLNKDVKTNVVLEFKDTDSKAWYARYVASAQKDGVVKGYEGNTFKPANSVTKAEFVKMLVESSGYNARSFPVDSKPFSDVEMGAWYTPYIALAKEKNLLDTSTNIFRPNEAISRGDVAQLLYRAVLMSASGKTKFEKGMVVNADDLASFYGRV